MPLITAAITSSSSAIIHATIDKIKIRDCFEHNTTITDNYFLANLSSAKYHHRPVTKIIEFSPGFNYSLLLRWSGRRQDKVPVLTHTVVNLSDWSGQL